MAKKAKSAFKSSGFQALSPEVSKMIMNLKPDPLAAPINATINGEGATCSPSPIGILVMFRGFDIAKPGSATVTVNGRHLPQDQWMSAFLCEGDDVKILPGSLKT
ncbi:MAG: hypothetical protein RL095_3858 [Verrucomicrobiota bacterium]|jgi:sulfur carrier protein ThiS